MSNSSYLPDTSKALDSVIAATKTEQATGGVRPRKWGRVRIESLPCNLGCVLDLSAGGLRIRSPKKLGGSVEVILGNGSQRLILQATVVWQKRRGWKSFEAGLSFNELSQDERAQLVKLMHCSTLARRVAA
jgi:hypothetical protein